MPRILLAVSTHGYQARSLAEAAGRLGVEVTLATDRCHVLEDPWLDRAIPVKFEEAREAAAFVEHELGGRRGAGLIGGVIALGDAPTVFAALAAERLGVPFHSAAATERCRDKARVREAFARAGMRVPGNFSVGVEEGAEGAAEKTKYRFGYPCVLKPTRLSASRGVIRANDREEFVAAFGRIRRILETAERGERAIQVEEYIPGREFAVEGLMTRGELRILAIFDKPDPLEGPFFEETLYVTPSREAEGVQRAIVEAVEQAVRALGLTHGPVHAEARVNEEGVWMLEVAARPIGGLCARVLQFRGNISLEDLLVRHAVGLMPAELEMARPAAGVMMVPIPRAGVFRGVSGVEEALATPGIEDAVITAVAGQRLYPPPEGGTYLGFLFAAGSDAGLVEGALREAHAKLNFDIAGTLDIITR